MSTTGIFKSCAIQRILIQGGWGGGDTGARVNMEINSIDEYSSANSGWGLIGRVSAVCFLWKKKIIPNAGPHTNLFNVEMNPQNFNDRVFKMKFS